MINIIAKKENNKIFVGISFDFSGLKKRLKCLKIAFKVAFGSSHIQIKENNDLIFVSLPVQKQNKKPKFNFTNFKKRFLKATAGISIFALLFQSSTGFFAPSNEDFVLAQGETSLCPYTLDIVLAIDITQSMDEGGQPSKCEWAELREVPGENYYTWFLNTKYNVTEEWCYNTHDSYDETTLYFSPKEPTYTPAIPSKIEATKQANKDFLDRLGSEDQSALVSFSGSSELKKQLSNSHSQTKTEIDNLTTQSGSNTDLAGAIDRAIDELSSQRANPFALKAIILLSDGSDANNDLVNQKAQEAAQNGYKIFTIGLGPNANQVQLQSIAQTTGGQYHFASSQTELENIYNQIAQELCQFASECQQSQIAGECIGDSQREYQIVWNYPYCGQNTTTTQIDESCACVQAEISRECVADGQAQVLYTFNFDYCGEDYTQLVEDQNCVCQSTEVSRECIDDGIAQVTYEYNFDYCGESTQEVDDPNCACQPIEISRQCIADGQAEVTFSYNFDYCGENYTEIVNDLSCGSEYECGEWENRECVDDGIIRQTRTCVDQYGNSIEESREVAEELCNCITQEIERTCIGDGIADVSYSWNYSYCGEEFSQHEVDDNCVCEYSEWENQECVGEGLRRQTRIQISQFEYCTVLERNIEDESCVVEEGQETQGETDQEEQAGQTEQEEIVCGNGIVEEGEECDDGNTQDGDGCSSLCLIEQQFSTNSQTTPSGGVLPPPLTIQEGSIQIAQQTQEENIITITWITSRPATSQVIYSQEGEPHTLDLNDNTGNPPKYGYAHTTPEYDTNPKVTHHSVTISDLVPGVTYYFRCVSRGSFVISEEQTFVLAVQNELAESSSEISQESQGEFSEEVVNEESTESGESTEQEVSGQEELQQPSVQMEKPEISLKKLAEEIEELREEIEKLGQELESLVGKKIKETQETQEISPETNIVEEKTEEIPSEVPKMKEEIALKEKQNPEEKSRAVEKKGSRNNLLAAISAIPLSIKTLLILLIVALLSLWLFSFLQKRKNLK